MAEEIYLTQYGLMAERHWREFLPKMVREMEAFRRVIDERPSLCYQSSVLRRFTIVLVLVFALLLAPQTPVRACALSMSAAQQADCPACCASMKSCILPRQNPTQSTSATTANPVPIAMIAPELSVLSREIPTASVSFPRLASRTPRHAPPQLAVLCTFLI